MLAPLPERMRPRTLNDFIGQPKLLGPHGALRRAIQNNLVPSMILWGPPGVGKTTLALAHCRIDQTNPLQFECGKLWRERVARCVGSPVRSFSPVVFIDEIHRYNKSQQDALLGAVEKGQITLIGATTENPSFEINSALLSRCQVYILEALGKEELIKMLHQAVEKDEDLKTKTIQFESYDALLRLSGGDGRKLLNLLELVVNAHTQESLIAITDEMVTEVAQQNMARYDKSGEQHYDIISAFHQIARK